MGAFFMKQSEAYLFTSRHYVMAANFIKIRFLRFRYYKRPGANGAYLTAITEISTFTSFGSRATSTASLAGGS